MDEIDYRKRIENSRVYDVAIESPLDVAQNLSRRVNNRILMKREDLQPVFSFKLRGAYNKIAGLSDDAVAAGVICSSAGNHAQGVALAARRRGVRAVIVMPVTTPRIKVDAVRTLGGEVVLHGPKLVVHQRNWRVLPLSATDHCDSRTPSAARPQHHSRDIQPATHHQTRRPATSRHH
jgi:threonine dehydratase